MHKNHLFTALFVCLSVAIFSFANPVATTAAVVNARPATPVAEKPALSLSTALYQQLHLGDLNLSEAAVDYAVKGYEKLVAEGAVANTQYLTIVDMSQSSRKKRFYLIDVKNNELVVNTFVSHGKMSGLDKAAHFSNAFNSEQTSLGFYVTGATYTGKHGVSLRLAGMEKGFNDNAAGRGVVVHGAPYVNAARATSDYMGRSQGCPALPEAEYAHVIHLIKGGSVLFVYHPTAAHYLQQSPLLNS